MKFVLHIYVHKYKTQVSKQIRVEIFYFSKADIHKCLNFSDLKQFTKYLLAHGASFSGLMAMRYTKHCQFISP